MSGAPDELRRDVAAWVRNAEEDRGIALSIDRALYANGVCFHCQQCVEKYLKALLADDDVVPERTHDLVALRDRVPARPATLDDDDLEMLSEFAVQIRYPEREATQDDATEAIDAMGRVRLVLREALGLETPEEGPETADQEDAREVEG